MLLRTTISKMRGVEWNPDDCWRMVAICNHSRGGISIGEMFDATLGHHVLLGRWIGRFVLRISAKQCRRMDGEDAIASRAAIAVLLMGSQLDAVCLQEGDLEPVFGLLVLMADGSMVEDIAQEWCRGGERILRRSRAPHKPAGAR